MQKGKNVTHHKAIFFSEYCVDCPKSASAESISNYNGTLTDLKNQVVSEVVVNGGDIDTWMAKYEEESAQMVEEILAELNQQ